MTIWTYQTVGGYGWHIFTKEKTRFRSYGDVLIWVVIAMVTNLVTRNSIRALDTCSVVSYLSTSIKSETDSVVWASAAGGAEEALSHDPSKTQIKH